MRKVSEERKREKEFRAEFIPLGEERRPLSERQTDTKQTSLGIETDAGRLA